MKIALINMPFAPPEGPSIGLTQIASVLTQRFGAQTNVRIHYLNLDVAAMMRASGFYRLAISPYARISGLADWFFRAAAFPDAEDNVDAYLARYYFDGTPESVAVADFIRNRRGTTIDFLDELIERYGLASADIIGFTLSFFQTVASLAMANRVKALNPGAMIVFGGPAVKGVLGKTLVEHAPSVDYVVSGPGLISFPDLVACRLSGELAAIPKIQGVFARGVEASLPPDKVEGPNIDINADLPLDYGSFLDHYETCMAGSGHTPFLLMQTSRGCWWADKQGCAFCGLNGLAERFEAMAPEKAILHIRSVLAQSNRVAYFVACDNVLPPNYFKEVFPQLTPPAGVSIKYETRSTITADEIQVLCKAGIRCVQPGVEALATESLRHMRKGVSAFNNIRFLKDCVRYSLFAEWNILLFSPCESELVYQKYEQDIPRLVHLQPPVGVFPVEFVRDSCYFEQPEAFGLDLEPHESLRYIYPFDRQTVSNLCYRFYDRNADQDMINAWLERLGALVEKWRMQWEGGPERRPRLILGRDEHSATIYDSRFSSNESYRISDVAEKILKAMASVPLTMKEVAVVSGAHECAARRELGLLRERGLLFEEEGRCLSLAVGETV